MSDQMVAGIHHVGVSARAALDLGNDSHHSPEADFRRRNLDGVLAARHGKRHVRLGVVLEVDGTPVCLAGSCLDELGRPGEVFLASDDVRLQAGDTQLFLASEVEMAELADGWDVAKDSQEIELALLRQRRSQPLPKSQPRRAHLQLDLFQKLLDASRRRHRLRALDPDDRALSFPVGEVELDQARRHQHATHQDEKDDDVLAEEPAARGRVLHLLKASARSKIFRGTVRPRSSAVLRFTARSIFSAPSTDRS